MRKMKKFSILALLFLTPACGSPASITSNGSSSSLVLWAELPIYISTQTADDDFVINQYNSYFGTEIFVSDPNGVTIRLVDEVNPDGLEPTTGIYDGRTDVTDNGNFLYDARIEILNNLQPSRYKCVLMHELGHVLGAAHMGHGIMQDKTLNCGTKDFQKNFDSIFTEWMTENYGL